MSRPKKAGNYLNVKINSDIYRRLVRVSDEAGQTKTVVVERALTAYMDDYDYKQEVLRGLDHHEPLVNTDGSAVAEAD